jgi:tetratricopeptide (TPR) repeat protein
MCIATSSLVAANADAAEQVLACPSPARTPLQRMCVGSMAMDEFRASAMSTSPPALLWLVARGGSISALAPLLPNLVTNTPALRNQAAELWALAARDSESARRVLVNDYNETPASLLALATNPGWSALLDRSPAAAVTRASRFEASQNHEGVFAALREAKNDDCEAQLVLGKTHRKLRASAKALAAFALASAPRCAPDVRKRAQYAALKWKATRNMPGLAADVDTFVNAYGMNDALADDALLWRAQHFLKANKIDAARRDLQRLVAEAPQGDMAADAVFAVAKTFLHEDKPAEAQAWLQQQLQAAPATLDGDHRDQWRYWAARLRLASDVRAPTKTASAAVLAEVIAEFQGLAKRPTWYGLLARLWLRDLGQPVPAQPALRPTNTPLAYLGPPDCGATDQGCIHGVFEPVWREADALLRQGALDEAGFLLDIIKPTPRDERAFVLAEMHMQRGVPGKAHAVLRNSGFARLDQALDGTDATASLRHHLAWPRAYVEELAAATSEARLPLTMMMGIAREESAFDPGIESWAGALGLCQLMPPTAAEEAAFLRLPPPSTADLLQPQLNARLGAAHLSRRVRSTGHEALAIAAYNAGPGLVKQWFPKGKQKSIALDWFVEEIPVHETRNYVMKVSGSWYTYALLDGAEPPNFSLTVKPY